jgi:long-chain acyl-CoA synthetase
MINCLSQLLPTAARQFSKKIALISEGRQFSFAELDQLAAQVAEGLRAQEVRAGDRVAIYSPNGWEWIASYHGILRTGAVVVPMNVMLTPSEVAYVAADSGVKVLFGTREKLAPLIPLKAEGTLSTLICFGDDALAGTASFRAITSVGTNNVSPTERAPDSLSTICYTSGTTGHPKGAMQAHRAVLMNVAMTAQLHARSVNDVVATALPCPHVYGNVVFNSALLVGATLVLHSTFAADEMLMAIERHRATIFDGVPTMYLYMLNSPRLDTGDLSSLTRCFVGGQTMPVASMEEVERKFKCPLIELWGMTELAGLGTTFPTLGPHKLGSIGIPLPHCDLRIAAVDDPNKTLGVGEVGEIMVRGPIVMQGYFGNEQATRQTIEEDGWMHSGDVGSRDADGAFYVVDRTKDLINTAGFKVYPAEVERVLATHPAVAMVAVGGRPDALKGEIAAAYVVFRPGVSAPVEQLLAHCRASLAAYKIPRLVYFVDDLPRTSSGKVMRRKLKELTVPAAETE